MKKTNKIVTILSLVLGAAFFASQANIYATYWPENRNRSDDIINNVSEDEKIASQHTEKAHALNVGDKTLDYARYKLGVVVSPQVKENYGAPAAVQAILKKHGIERSQESLAEELGTTSTGTLVQNIAPVLNRAIGWDEYPADGKPGYRLAQLRVGNKEDRELLQKRIVQDYLYGDPVIFLANSSYLGNEYSEGDHYYVGNGYRFAIGKLGWHFQALFFDTQAVAYDSYYGYEQYEYIADLCEAIEVSGGYYIW